MANGGAPSNPHDIGLMVTAMCRTRKKNRTSWKTVLEYLNCMAATSAPTGSKTIPTAVYDLILECMMEELEWKEGLRLVKMMENPTEGIIHPKPQGSTYRNAAVCCLRAGQVDEAIVLLYSMRDNCFEKVKFCKFLDGSAFCC